jgi:hypothetical protein
MTKRLEELKKKYGCTERSAELINRIDPTVNKKYVEWLFKVRYIKIGDGSRYRTNTQEFPASKEGEINFALTWYEKNLNGKIPVEFRDINKFKTLTEFLTKVNELATPSRSEIKASVRTVLDNDRFKIIVPLTYETSKMYGAGTKWCTTNKNHYDDYTEKGELYYILDKSLDRKFGLHVPDNAGKTVKVGRYNFFNNEDESLTFNTIKKIYGERFNEVIGVIEEDFKIVIVNKLKKKTLGDAIKKIVSIKNGFTNSNLKDEDIELTLDSLLSKIGVMEKLFQ